MLKSSSSIVAGRLLAVPPSRRLLILGGTGEARALADALSMRPGLEVTTSLAGRTVEPRRPKGNIRVGGFGGALGMADYLESAAMDRVIDATHPYAAAISAHAAEACRIAGRPLLRFERKAWATQTGDRWIVVDNLGVAASVAPEIGKRAFLTIGVKELAAFAAGNIWFLVRLVDRPAEPIALSNHELVLARGPFTLGDERALMERHRVDLVIAKNSGGEATYAKIAAARELGLPVLLLRRPALPPAETASTIAEAIGWVEASSGRDKHPPHA
jgi:precorrin-6A/cobalt-precorrin-6A reductase